MARPRASNPITFRVYPEKHTLYFVVFVWQTQKAMYDYYPLRRRHLACCKGMEIRNIRTGRWKPQLGEIHFTRSRLRMEIITHECGHAALQWAERMGLPVRQASALKITKVGPSENEERFCHALGNMAGAIAQQGWDQGLFK